ncbi:MAG: sulfotransferase domain-containing protein [Actinomycetota bacterium]|nr:sulfotransferase domain-containing protein [Actinomycetota bacterium]
MRGKKTAGQGPLHPERVQRALAWRWRLATAPGRALPDFVILGAQRSGTTSLFDHLSHHRQILAPWRKEIHFHDLHHSRGIRWYRANFPLTRFIGPDQITGEATPNYLVHPDAPPRLARVTPQAKLVVMVRNPVERAHSAWRLRSMEGRETATFEEAVRKEYDGPVSTIGDFHQDRKGVGDALRYLYLAKGRYAEQIQRWLEHFPQERLLVIKSEDLFSDPEPVLSELWRFLGVGTGNGASFPAINQTSPAPIDPGFRSRLVAYFEPHNQVLEELVGRPFHWE